MGFQPRGSGGVATPGYTAYVAKKLKMQLENFGCAGATTTSIVSFIGCASPFGPPAGSDAASYPTSTQEQATLDFIAAHPGSVDLITISIGGNDIIPCAVAANPVTCIESADATIDGNLTSLVDSLSSALSSAGDTNAQIIGQSYLDTFLGSYVNPGGAAGQSLALLSQLAFDDYSNPTLQPIYTSETGGSFLDVATAPYKKATSGVNTPLTILQELAPYGRIPVSVREICELTYQCSELNGHPDDKGYTFIGKLVVADYASHWQGAVGH